MPPVPHPSASATETHAFITELLYVNSALRTREEADTLANKITGTGAFFYRIPLEKWEDAFQIEGLYIYELLQNSKYGNVIVLCLLSFAFFAFFLSSP